MYTMQDWERDGSLKLTVGQRVSDEVVNQLINCVPPAFLGGGLFQAGEPASTDAETYASLFDTYRREEEGWTYLGACLYGKTEHRESLYEKMDRERLELQARAAAIPPQMVGDLYFTDRHGEQHTPGVVYFSTGRCFNHGADYQQSGLAYCHYDNCLNPVMLCRNGNQMMKPEWAGLCAKFRDGFLRDFYVE